MIFISINKVTILYVNKYSPQCNKIEEVNNTLCVNMK